MAEAVAAEVAAEVNASRTPRPRRRRQPAPPPRRRCGCHCAAPECPGPCRRHGRSCRLSAGRPARSTLSGTLPSGSGPCARAARLLACGAEIMLWGFISF